MHRPANVDDPATLAAVVAELATVARRLPLVFPIHPRTRHRLAEFGLAGQLGAVRLVEPLGYIEFMSLVCDARLVITDSGGVQEETTYLGVPCLTARANTERPVTISMGTNTLVASRRAEIVTAALRKLGAIKADRACPPLWDGRTAGRVAALLRDRE
jgi:UDP-N-acetylglucosamine 2-epimerase (non-hydrolysing)